MGSERGKLLNVGHFLNSIAAYYPINILLKTLTAFTSVFYLLSLIDESVFKLRSNLHVFFERLLQLSIGRINFRDLKRVLIYELDLFATRINGFNSTICYCNLVCPSIQMHKTKLSMEDELDDSCKQMRHKISITMVYQIGHCLCNPRYLMPAKYVNERVKSWW